MFGLSSSTASQPQTVLVTNNQGMTKYNYGLTLDNTQQAGKETKTTNANIAMRTFDSEIRPSDNTVGVVRNGDVLFNSDIMVVIKTNDNAERRKTLHATVSEKSVSSSHSKEIQIQLTDSQDSFFYYSLRLAEDDFQNLKSQQGLLVDFASFPSMLVQLLDKCLEESRSDNPKFILVLNCCNSSTTLEFIELNFFKHLCHLSVIVVKANDTQLKDYLADCIKKLTVERTATFNELNQTVENLQGELRNKTEAFDSKSRELETLRLQLKEESTSLGQRLTEEVSQEKERCTASLTELQMRYERERRETEHRHGRTVEQLENRVASLDVQNKDLTEVRYRHEANIRELRNQLSVTEEENGKLKVDLATKWKETSNLDASNVEKERRLQQLTTRVAVVEQELQDKVRIIGQQQELVRAEKEYKQRLEAEMEGKVEVVARRETAVKNVTEELMKANEIIRKLQEQLRQQQAKVKLRSQIASEQEKVLCERDSELADVREQLKTNSEDLALATEKVDTLEGKIGERDKKVEDLEKMIKTNENVINWLNKQMTVSKSPGLAKDGTEARVTPGTTGYSAGPAASTDGVIAGRGKLAGRRLAARAGRIEEAEGTVAGQLRKNKENEPGLDPKYFMRTNPEAGTTTRHPIPAELPSNVRNNAGRTAGLVRKPFNQSKRNGDAETAELVCKDLRT